MCSSLPCPWHTQNSKSFFSLGLSFPPVKWGEASFQCSVMVRQAGGGREGPERPLPSGPGPAQGPAWLLFPQNNMQQAGGLVLGVPDRPPSPRVQFLAQFIGCRRASGLETHGAQVGRRG